MFAVGLYYHRGRGTREDPPARSVGETAASTSCGVDEIAFEGPEWLLNVNGTSTGDTWDQRSL